MSRLLVTLCTYNERENLQRLVEEIHRAVPEADVLVIDDASPDGTGRIADEMAANDARVSVIHRAGKLGLGTATVEAFRYGIVNGYDLLVNMDADFSHAPERIPVLVGLMADADVAIGSRYVPGGEIVGWTLSRHLMSRGVNLLSRTLLGLTAGDTSGSFRCYRVGLLQRIDFDRIVAKGYAFEEEILFRCAKLGARFVESPIRFEDRRAGRSKINTKEVITALRDIGVLGLENLRTKSVRQAERPSTRDR